MSNEGMLNPSLHRDRKVPIIGFSGTMARDDGKPLGLVYQQVIYHLDIAALLKQGL
jgi:superfamily II DNA or RNA helicase